jgi:hypothetical protein
MVFNRRIHLLFSLLLAIGGCHGNDFQQTAGTRYQARDLQNLLSQSEPRFPTYQWDEYQYNYPDVNPRMGETNSTKVTWEARGEYALRLSHTLYEFDSPREAQGKFNAFQRQFFYTTSYIFPKLFSRQLDIYKPEVFDHQSAVASQEDFGCVDHDYGKMSSFARCGYIAQYGSLISVVTIVFVEHEHQVVLLQLFEQFVEEVDSALR